MYLTHLYFSPKAAYLIERLYGIKIMGIQEIENFTLGHLYVSHTCYDVLYVLVRLRYHTVFK